MISSTNPSRPMKAVRWLARSTDASRRLAHCSRSSQGECISVRLHPENTQNPLQVSIVEKFDLERTFAQPIAKLHFRPKTFADFAFNRGQVRIAYREPGTVRGFAGGRRSGVLVLQVRDQFFRLPHRQS